MKENLQDKFDSLRLEAMNIQTYGLHGRHLTDCSCLRSIVPK